MADEDPKPAFSEEQVNSLKQLVSGIVNSAIRTRDQMSDKKRGEDRDAIKGEFAKLLDEKFASFKPPDPDPPGDGKGGGKRKGDETELATMRTQLMETRARVEAAEKRASEERAKNEAAELRERAERILSPSGITGTRFRGAFAFLKERIVKESDEADAPYVFVDDNNEQVDLEVGLKGWTKGEDAKIYMPPSGAGGSGARRAAQPPAARSGKQEVTHEDVGNYVLGLVSPGTQRLGE